MTGCQIRPLALDGDELAKTFGLLKDIWPNPKISLRYLEWLYLENPEGRAIGCNAWDGDMLAGHYAAVPALVHIAGRDVRALLSLHTAVHRDYRGRGIFAATAERAYEIGAEQGFDHVFGVANANSSPGFVRNLGFQLVSPLELQVIGTWPALEFPIVSSPGWKRRWTESGLRWRLAHPRYRYQRCRRGDLEVVLLQHAYLPTIVRVDPADASTRADVPFRLALPKVWVGLDPRLRLPALSLPIPERFRSSPLNLIFRSLRSSAERLEPGGVVFAGLDFDVF